MNPNEKCSWSPSEKKIARAAFDFAYKREMAAAKREVETMLRGSPDPHDIWRVHDYLSEKRREINQKYDYRYSMLMLVFGRLLSEGWITELDLAGLAPEKLEALQRMVSFLKA